MSAALRMKPAGYHLIEPNKIPAELQDRPHWVVWRYAIRRKKRTKVPFRSLLPHAEASSTDPESWSTFGEAIDAAADLSNNLDGIGFVFAPDDGLAGIDLDRCLDESGTLLPWAVPILDRLPGYAEVSPSGRGVKLFVAGSVPGGKGRKLQRLGEDGTGVVECYDRGRYFTVTGRAFRGGGQVVDASAELATLHAEWFPPTPKRARVSASPPTLGDAELIAKAHAARNGPKFSALWGGVTDGYPSKSEADLALCSMLAFWVGGDVGAVERLFNQSGLRDGKWDDRPDYREVTIAKAVDRAQFYDPTHGLAVRIAGTDDDSRDRPPLRVVGDDDSSVGVPPAEPLALPRFSNYHPEFYVDSEGRDKMRSVPHALHKITSDLTTIACGWPKRIREKLFIESGRHEPVYLNSAARLFSWLDQRSAVDWTKGSRFITQERFYESQRMTAEQYDTIETMPHFPAMPGVYYMHPALPEPSGKLDELLDRFAPASPEDRELLKSLIVTPSWGGRPGTRPAFLVTGPDGDPEQGRGLGKSTLLDLISDGLYLGSLDVSANEDMGVVKTRMLSSEGALKRIMRLDNVKSLRFSWADLENLISASQISGRALYEGEGRRPNSFIWIITLNGASLSKDMAQRVVTVKLRRPPKEPRWRDETAGFIRDFRWEILADIGRLLQAEPGGLVARTRWASWEQEVLSKMGRPESCQQAMIERQESVDEGNHDRDTVRDFLCERIVAGGYDPDKALLRIPSRAMAVMVSKATRNHYATNTSTTFVAGLSIPELIYTRENTFRGWIWNGKTSIGVDPVLFDPYPSTEEDYPRPGRSSSWR